MTKSLTRRALPLVAVVAVLAVPIVAAAAPDRTLTVSAATPEVAWDGPAANGDYTTSSYDPDDCSKESANYCDQTLIKIESGGPVTVDSTVADYSNPLADFDLHLYKSDATGAAVGDDLAPTFDSGGDTGWPNGFEESAHLENIQPGYYVLIVAYYQSFGGSYKGTFKITGATPGGGGTATATASPGGTATATVTATVTATATPSPTATPRSLPLRAATVLGSAKKAKKKKALKFKVTAGEDITDLVLTLVKGAKKVLGTARIASLPKGTRKIKLKVAKKIKKGRYQLTSQGTVNGATLRAAQKVKIKK